MPLLTLCLSPVVTPLCFTLTILVCSPPSRSGGKSKMRAQIAKGRAKNAMINVRVLDASSMASQTTAPTRSAGRERRASSAARIKRNVRLYTYPKHSFLHKVDCVFLCNVEEGESEVAMQAFAIPPGYPWFPGFAQTGKDGQPQAYPYPYFITPMPAPPPHAAAGENGGGSSSTNGTPATAAAATAATAFPYQMYYGAGYPYMPGWPADPAQAAAAMAAMQQLAGMAAGASREKEVKMEDDDEKESEDEDGEGEIEESSVRRKPPTPPPPKPKEPAKKTKGKETAKRKSRAK